MTERVSHRARLQAIARQAMIDRGFEPDLPPAAQEELERLTPPDAGGPRDRPDLRALRDPRNLRDLRDLVWSSIDNRDSRDLDQLEVVREADSKPTTLLVAIADVDALVHRGSALDDHARTNTTSVYTPAQVFPMLPEPLSTDRTSLNADDDRAAVVVEMQMDHDGAVIQADLYPALVRNHARLSYPDVSAWLEGRGAAPEALSHVEGLANQLRTQDRIAGQLRARRHEEGALELDRDEPQFTLDHDDIQDVRPDGLDRARDLIESVMVAANGATARFLAGRGYPSIRRVVRTPKRWPRIVEVAAGHGVRLPDDPDALALQRFLSGRRNKAPDEFPDLSLTIVKLLGSGEYVATPPGAPPEPHFALAARDYTHATAPNRRFPDLVTQRLLKAAIRGAPAPYPMDELNTLAAHCTRQEDEANKVERLVRKAAAALWIGHRIGDSFEAIVTGASPKGTWVRLTAPPIEGKLEHGTEGLDVGDRVRVRLVHTDPERGFIDFVRV